MKDEGGGKVEEGGGGGGLRNPDGEEGEDEDVEGLTTEKEGGWREDGGKGLDMVGGR